MYDAFIFDMDGTLFQTEKILEASLEDTFNYLRSLQLWFTETPLEKYRQIMGVPLPTVWRTLLPDSTDQVRNDANDYFHTKLIESINANKGSLYPNVVKLLRFLKEKGCLLLIASNGQVEYLKAIVRYYQLDNWVTETFSIQQIPSQDKCDLVEAIVKKYDIRKGAVVGDRLSDIKAAKRNRLYAIGCNFYFAQAEELVHADMVVDNFEELIAHLSTSNER